MIKEKFLNYERILLLQGPKGWFFYSLGKYLKSIGKKVYKINFNGGDLITYPDFKHSYSFRGLIEEWKDFLTKFIEQNDIHLILLFGDYKPYHKIAIDLAREINLTVYVFEEGYVRPSYITMEKNGINGASSLVRDPQFYLNQQDIKIKEPLSVNFKMSKRILASIVHFLFLELLKWRFPNYVPYKKYSPYINYIFCFVRGGFRKIIYKFTEKRYCYLITESLKKKYFFVPLQVYNDSQIKIHSNYNSIEEFISEVIESFSKSASSEFYLVFKHHPQDRGFTNYRKIIKTTARKFGVEGRVIYIHDLNLPTLIKNSLGVIVVNSTVGFQSLFHNIPVKVMGKAIYDIPGLTDQNSINSFFRNPQKINKVLFHKFRNYVISTTQLNGSFYGRFHFE